MRKDSCNYCLGLWYLWYQKYIVRLKHNLNLVRVISASKIIFVKRSLSKILRNFRSSIGASIFIIYFFGNTKFIFFDSMMSSRFLNFAVWLFLRETNQKSSIWQNKMGFVETKFSLNKVSITTKILSFQFTSHK